MLRRLLKDPFVHFLVIGAVMFAVFTLRNPPAPEADPREIVVTPQTRAGLEAQFARTWQRQPTGEELQALIDSHVRAEILAAEARALGLDDGDAVIRQRLVQKMEFLLGSAANLAEAGDEEIAAYYAANAARYAEEPRISFRQVYLGQGADPATVASVAADLSAGADPQTVGERTMLPPEFTMASARSVDAVLGRGVAEALAGLPLGQWTGPVLSGFGAHMIFVSARDPGRIPPLGEVRDRVEADWRQAQSEELLAAAYDEIATGYGVRVIGEDGE